MSHEASFVFALGGSGQNIAGQLLPYSCTPMSNRNNYVRAYAVLRVDGTSTDSPARVTEFEHEGRSQPTAGPAHISVKQVVMSAQVARDEVMRLNETNKDAGCKYYWQSTHLFLDGGSHSSQEPTTTFQD